MELVSVVVKDVGKTAASDSAPHGRHKMFLRTQWKLDGELFNANFVAWGAEPLTGRAGKGSKPASKGRKRAKKASKA